MSNEILIVMVGYKDKNLAEAVRHIKRVTRSRNRVYVFDQHPIKHEDDFAGISGCDYEHKIWDDINGPAHRRATKVFDNIQGSSHVCIISPDISLSDGWDTNLIVPLDTTGKKVVFSGSGKVSLFQKDLFSFGVSYDDSKTFNMAQMIDRNFIFARAEAFKEIQMPDFLKYHGENEYLSLAFISAGYDIMSIPANMYQDSLARSVENTYHTFSLEHNYNVVIDILSGETPGKYDISEDAVRKFLEFHGMFPNPLIRLPYATNDVDYNPYALKMHGVDARRFIAGTKAIY